jgi:uncharacterized protein YjbI with pentapeptide repeats
MQVYKPLSLGLLSRAVEYRKRFGLCLSGFLHVPFEQGETGRLWGEQSLWNFVSGEMATPLLDEGIAKLTPEFLVHGHAYPGPGATQGCAVRVRLGDTEKTVLAFANRYWDGDAPRMIPAAAEPIPLTWDKAYGGPDYPLNTLGTGRVDAQGRRWLPNLELPHSRVLTPRSEVVPAGFGPLESLHPQRVKFRGTYDDTYLQAHSPGFPPDLDWKHFNLAPSDQWLAAPLKGDEPFALDNLHPTLSRIEGRLPGLRVRMFVNYNLSAGEGAKRQKLREVPMRLTTVWFFPHAQRMVLVFHGMAECAEDDGSDIAAVLGGVERLGEPKDDAHYVDVLARRSDPADGGIEALNDTDLLPHGIDMTDPASEQTQEAFRMDGLQGEAQRRRAEIEVQLARDAAVAQGKDPDALGLKLPPQEKTPPMAELPAYIKAKRDEARVQQWAGIERIADELKRAMDLEDAGKIDLGKLAHRGPPRYNADLHMAELMAQRSQGAVFDAAAVERKLGQREAVERARYLQSAHLQPPAHALQGQAAADGRAQLRWMLEHGLRNMPGIDLTGADLSALDLRDVNFTDAWLESANLQGANLSGACFQRAVLAHAKLDKAVAIRTDFTGANLGHATLADAVLDEATLAGTMLGGCNLAATQSRGANIAAAHLLDTTWGVADWSRVQGAQSFFYKLKLQGLQLTEAELSGSNFVECDLGGVDLRGARLGAATFLQCNLAGARLEGAQLDGAVFAKGCSLAGADLSQASLKNANLAEVDLRGAKLVKAQLAGAHLSLAQLGGCDARLANLEGALLRRTVLARARLAGASFKGAVMQHADLRSADLRKANLFGADLSRTKLDADVRFDGALLERVRTWPRLSPAQQAQYAAERPL